MDELEKSKIHYENYIFKEKDLEVFESIFSIIIKSKLTIFELVNLPVILRYMDPYHRKTKSIELLNKIVNEENKIDTEKKTYFINTEDDYSFDNMRSKALHLLREENKKESE